MSEYFPNHHEALPPPGGKVERLLPTAEQAEPLRRGEADPQKLAAEARHSIEQSVGRDNPLERLQASENAAQPSQSAHINSELKSITLRRELQSIRRRLPAPQRALSKVIHQPVVRMVSEAAGKSVSRPSGLLGGGLVAFLGSSGYLYLARHDGFAYNYGVFLTLFVVGFFFGLILEYAVYLATLRQRAHD
jgi:hypothetical protein